jgi:hypothetical protein
MFFCQLSIIRRYVPLRWLQTFLNFYKMGHLPPLQMATEEEGQYRQGK